MAWRSDPKLAGLQPPTAKHGFPGRFAFRSPQLRNEEKSAGTQPEARIVITEGHIGWADLIFVMEKSHLHRLRRKFPAALDGKRVVALHIRDDSKFMHPDLLDELHAKLAPFIDFGESA